MDENTNCPRCGARMPAGGPLEALCPACLLGPGTPVDWQPPPHLSPLPDIEEVRARFREFEILEPIGRGGTGVVYRARQPRLDRVVALKVLHPHIAADPAFSGRFLREARALAKLNHPSIVAVYDFGEVEGSYFLLMEYVDGVSLRERLEADDLDGSDVLEIVPQICAGLQYAHEHGVVHRDIKPENILLDDRGMVKIADFGLAKIFEGKTAALTRKTQVMGTPHYMAPEQVNRPLEVDHRADIYSLGVVLYEMLTSELPVGRFAPPSARSPESAGFDPVVLKALEREPVDRYQRIDEVRSDVEGVGVKAAAGMDVGPEMKREATAGDERVLWFEREKLSPTVIGTISLILGWSLMVVLQLPDFLSVFSDGITATIDHRASGSAGKIPHNAMAVAYPFAFLGLLIGVTARVRSRPGSWLIWPGSLTCVAIVTYLSADPGGDLPTPLLELIAGTMVILAQVQADRWVRGQGWHLLAVAAAFVICATILHSSLSQRADMEAVYYSSGMVAIIGLGSLVGVIPEYLRRSIPRWAHGTLVRALILGGGGAVFYFEKYL